MKISFSCCSRLATQQHGGCTAVQLSVSFLVLPLWYDVLMVENFLRSVNTLRVVSPKLYRRLYWTVIRGFVLLAYLVLFFSSLNFIVGFLLGVTLVLHFYAIGRFVRLGDELYEMRGGIPGEDFNDKALDDYI